MHEGGVVLVDVPEPEGDGVLVRVAGAGICGTDLRMLNRGLTVTLGHEFAGWLDDGTPVAVEPARALRCLHIVHTRRPPTLP